MSGIITDSDVDKTKKEVDRPSRSTESSPVLNPIGTRKVRVPGIFLWSDKENGVICGAFRWRGSPWGICFPYAENKTRRDMDGKHLRVRLRDTLDLLLHHGEKVLNSDGDFDQRKINDMEAERHWADPLWARRVEAFKEAVVFKEISKTTAEKLKLLL